MDGRAQGFCDLGKSFHRDFVLRSLHVPDVIPRELCLFSEFFLRKAGLHPGSADVFTQLLRHATSLRHGR